MGSLNGVSCPSVCIGLSCVVSVALSSCCVVEVVVDVGTADVGTVEVSSVTMD